MIKRISIMLLLVIVWKLAKCQFGNDVGIIAKKNSCYQDKLDKLKAGSLYRQVFLQFKDTAKSLLSQIDIFGVPGYAENKLDDALFLNKNNKECLLLILQRPNGTTSIFAQTRVIYGNVLARKWTFKVGPAITFEKDYYKSFVKNDFENISKISRYYVITSGKENSEACDLDEEFWFFELKNN